MADGAVIAGVAATDTIEGTAGWGRAVHHNATRPALAHDASTSSATMWEGAISNAALDARSRSISGDGEDGCMAAR